jgi:PhoH-like ATPase
MPGIRYFLLILKGFVVVIESKEMQKPIIYVLDTNVLIDDPGVLSKFENGVIGIAVATLEELDKLKQWGTEAGRGARAVIRELDLLHKNSILARGAIHSVDCTSRVQIFFDSDHDHIVSDLSNDLIDNRIILLAYTLERKGYEVIFVSRDINARLKAYALGITVQDYYKKELISHETLYKGWIRVPVPAAELKKELPSLLSEMSENRMLVCNQFILLESQHNALNYKVYRYLGNKQFTLVENNLRNCSLQPRNPQQLMAIDLLLDPRISLVSLYGPAGTGKTFLALLAGLHNVMVENRYEKILISRPIIPLGRDIGYLPGTLEEKLRSWILPIYDNIDCIAHATRKFDHLEHVQTEQRSHRFHKHRKNYKKETLSEIDAIYSLDELIQTGKIKIEAITYMRGRSIPYQYILIDEAQNLSSHEIKTLISRVGQQSKIILTGDPYQIDAHSLDFNTNGLIVATERFRGQSLFGAVYLETSERSKLSELAGILL